ncbi:hypothetical protein FJY71_00055 [candidate division WOR-3 bacterium]|nr:hypothetical protein [candidate division WOR-3 bacterium]
MVPRRRSLSLGALLLVYAALADTLSVGLGDVAYIAGPVRGQTRGRVLVAMALPQPVQPANIDFACLQIPSPLLTGQGGIVTIQHSP